MRQRRTDRTPSAPRAKRELTPEQREQRAEQLARGRVTAAANRAARSGSAPAAEPEGRIPDDMIERLAAAHDPRAPRSMEARYLDERDPFEMEEMGILHIDPRLVPKDEEWIWIREATNQMPDPGNIEKNFAMGYQPVLAADVPGLAVAAFDGITRSDKYIRRGGQLLCKIPKALADRRRAKLNRETRDRELAVDRDRVAAMDRRAVMPMSRRETGSRTIRERNGERRAVDYEDDAA
jgi:hypothetical protein